MSIFEKLKAEQEAKRKQTAEHSEVKVEPSPFPQQVASPAPPPTEKPILIAAATPEAVKIIEAQKVAEKVVEKVEAASILPSQPSATSPPSHIAVQTSPIVKEPIIKSKLWEGTEGKNAVKEEKGIGIMIYGDKGVGKTTDAFSLIDLNPEYTIACLSFDKKGQKIKDTIFHGNSRIQVFDPLKYFSADTDEELLQTSVDTFDYMMWLL